MKRIHRVLALLVLTALMVAMVAMAGATSAFGNVPTEAASDTASAGAVEGIGDADAGEIHAHAGGSLD
jgi:predicted lysophospholipase L1 biosynthesis ABC-type transport system permease subunit